MNGREIGPMERAVRTAIQELARVDLKIVAIRCTHEVSGSLVREWPAQVELYQETPPRIHGEYAFTFCGIPVVQVDR